MRESIIIALSTFVSSSIMAASAAVPLPSPSPAAMQRTGPATSLTLQEAIKIGVDYSPDIKKADSGIKQTHDQLNQEKGALFPTINGVGLAQNKQNASTFVTGAIPTVVSSNGDFYQFGLTLSQPLYVGGALTSGLSYYKNLEDQAKQNYYNIKQTILYNIINAYYGLAQAQETLEAALQNRDILKSYLDITSYYERIGRARQIDKMQATVNFSLANVTVEQAQNSYTNALSNLDKVLGVNNDKVYRTTFKVKISGIGALTLDQAFDAANDNNPTIVADKLKVEEVGYQEGIDLSQDLPSLYLQGQFGYQAPDVPDVFDNSSQYYAVGLNLTVPIFSGLSSIAKRASYGEQDYQAKKALQSDQDTLRTSVQNSLLTIRSTEVQLDVAQKSDVEARKALDMANKAYRQGTASSQDVLNLQTTRYSADALFITTEYSYLNSLLGLRQEMGIDLEKAYGH